MLTVVYTENAIWKCRLYLPNKSLCTLILLQADYPLYNVVTMVFYIFYLLYLIVFFNIVAISEAADPVVRGRQ